MKNFYKTLFIAFLISLIIHFIMYRTIDKTLHTSHLQINTSNKKQNNTQNGLVKIQYVKIKKSVPKEKELHKKPVKKKPTQKIKKIIKNHSIEKKVFKKKKILPKKLIKKPIPIVKLPSIPKKTLDLKRLFTIQKNEPKYSENKSVQIQQKEQEIQQIQELSEETQSYIKLYGEQYFTYSKEQKRYLRENLSRIGKITQRYLSYPSISIRTKQHGVNIVEFYLHPNGDISELKLSDSSYYTALDENSIYTIKLAYQDYPKPLEKVKIKIYVRYTLY